MAVQVHPADTVAVALVAIPAGTMVPAGGHSITVMEDIPAGHKFAVRDMARDTAPVRYGHPFGRTTTAIARGAHVHSHNVHTMLGVSDRYRYSGQRAQKEPAQASTKHFKGYVRPDGTIGTRNEIWILPTVGCVGRTAERLATMANKAQPTGIDGVHAFAQPFGCSQLGDDLEATAAILAALACHPNAGGVLLLGLGCESNQLASLLARVPPERHARIRTLGTQTARDEIADGLGLLDELIGIATHDRRKPVPLSALRLGVKCGGSDGLSGLTANPLIGRMADAVGDAGGSVILTEIPEIFGAEQILIDRCVDQHTADALLALTRSFKRYFADHGEPVSENPSLGNVQGGITTLEEKSLGAVQKGGHVPVTDVIRYAARASKPGLTILEAPGNDAVSTTGLAAAGATMTLFSTGRGTPLGSPVPTVKIASNTTLAQAKPKWIDFDGGTVLERGMDSVAEDLLNTIIAIASGQRTCNETNDERGIALWKRGVTL